MGGLETSNSSINNYEFSADFAGTRYRDCVSLGPRGFEGYSGSIHLFHKSVYVSHYFVVVLGFVCFICTCVMCFTHLCRFYMIYRCLHDVSYVFCMFL